MEIENLKKAVNILQNSKYFSAFIPEVRSNIVMAKKDAEEINDVAGIPGRITAVHDKPRVFTEPEFGASSHMARFVLNIMKHDPSKRSVMNIKFDEKIINICEKLGLKVSYYDRNGEPEEVKNVEGGTIPWGVEIAIKKVGEVPDVIYHQGAWGKEPSIVLIGTDAIDVAKMAICISKLFNTIKGPEVLFAPQIEKSIPKKPEISCVFCAMANGEPEPSKNILYNDGENMVVLNINPYTKGHLLVVPTKHYTDLTELDSNALKNLFKTVQNSLILIREVIRPDGVNIGLNLGEAAGQHIEHTHIHLVPRFNIETTFIGATTNTRIIRENLDDTYAQYIAKIEILDNIQVLRF